MTDHLDDPVDLLFGAQLGGGTDIARAVAYAAAQVLLPDKTILIVVTDLYEGGDEAVLPSEAEAVVRFETNRADDDLGEVLAHLVHAGIRVSQFRAVVSDLEDAFLTVTRKDAEAA